MITSKIKQLILIIFTSTLLTGCITSQPRENYFKFNDSGDYSKIEAKNIQCSKGICEAYIVLVSPREFSDYRYGVNAGQPTERTYKMRFFCNENAYLILMTTERTIDGQKVIGSSNNPQRTKQYAVPNSHGSAWEAYVCEGQKNYRALD